jgi:CO dehydrogenase/acetyl-CoA synthase beta subunit
VSGQAGWAIKGPDGVLHIETATETKRALAECLPDDVIDKVFAAEDGTTGMGAEQWLRFHGYTLVPVRLVECAPEREAEGE